MGIAIGTTKIGGFAVGSTKISGLAIGTVKYFSLSGFTPPSISSTNNCSVFSNLQEVGTDYEGYLFITTSPARLGGTISITFNKQVKLSYIIDDMMAGLNGSSTITYSNFGTTLVLDIEENTGGDTYQHIIELEDIDDKFIILYIDQAY